MVLDTMKGINDLGDKNTCEGGDMADAASYITMQLNLTHLPIPFISGLCLPKECTQEKLTHFGDRATSLLNSILSGLEQKFVEEPIVWHFISNDTKAYLQLTDSTEAADDWAASLQTGYIFALIICSLIMLTLCILPNIYHLKLHYQGRSRQLKYIPELDWAYQCAPQYKA